LVEGFGIQHYRGTFGGRRRDGSMIFGSITLGMIGVSLAAMVISARRAARVSGGQVGNLPHWL
jgi:hypothetical protein